MVETVDAVLVGKSERMQEVKDVVARIKRDGRSEAIWRRKVYHPRRSGDSIDNGQRHQGKRITVKPGGALSLRMCHYRV